MLRLAKLDCLKISEVEMITSIFNFYLFVYLYFLLGAVHWKFLSDFIYVHSFG